MRLREQIAADLARFEQAAWRTLAREPQHRWLLLYRIADGSDGVVRSVLAQVVKRRGARLGYTIPLGTLGPALRLSHRGTIVISGAARIGYNCQIYQSVTIGGDRRGAPRIGDNVFVGPGVTIVGPVVIGDGAWLAAGSNIRSDVPPGAKVMPVDDAPRQ